MKSLKVSESKARALLGDNIAITYIHMAKFLNQWYRDGLKSSWESVNYKTLEEYHIYMFQTISATSMIKLLQTYRKQEIPLEHVEELLENYRIIIDTNLDTYFLK